MTGGGLKPTAAHSDWRDHAPESDAPRRRSSTHVAANGRPMRCRVKARFSRAEQVTATRATAEAARAPACSHEGDRGGLLTGLLLQQRSGKHPAWRCAPAGGRACRQRHVPRSKRSILEALAATVVRCLQRRACDRHQGGRLENRRRVKTSGVRNCAERRQTEATTTEMDLLLSLFYRGEEIHFSCCWVSWLGR